MTIRPMSAGRRRARSSAKLSRPARREGGDGVVTLASARHVAPILVEPRVPGREAIVARFGPMLGPRFARNSLAILRRVQAAYVGLRASARRIRGRGVN